MAKEEAAKQEQDELEDSTESHKKESGNFFSKYGKIFLIIGILFFQAGGAYGVINIYYEDIYNWLDEMSPEGNVYHKIENIIINPANSNGERYLILTIAIEVDSEGDVALLEKYEAKVVDKVNYILTRRTADELADVDVREEIKQELGIAINKTIDKKAVRNLFFIKYVLQ